MTSKFSGLMSFAPLARRAESRKIDLSERLLAESVRCYEEAQGEAISDSGADALARQADGTLEQRVIARAKALAIAPSLTQAMHQLGSASRWAVIAALLGAALSGAAAAQVALGSAEQGPVNFFLVVGSVLGLHSLALLIWLILLSVNPGAIASGSLGGAVLALGRRITRWLHKGPLHMAVIRASGSVFTRTTLGRWVLSALSHALWLAFLSGCLILILLILSTKQYTFAWETTILSDRTYVIITRVLASVPEALGFITPDAQQIMASHWTRQGDLPGDAREAWSGLLVGSIVAYGLLPRALLLVFSLLAGWRAGRRLRLDLSAPGYARLRTHLMPEAQTIGIVDADTAPADRPAAPPAEERYSIRAEGPVGILGLEIEPPRSSWPPPLKGVEWLDLGFVDSRAERHRVQQQILSALPPPRAVVVVCSLTATPDRGIGAFIGSLQKTAHSPVVILLSEGERLRSRGFTPAQMAERIEDWRRLGEAAQVSDERVIELDLDHLTDSSRAKLNALLGTRRADGAAGQRLEQSFALIGEHIERWQGEPPSAGEQAELHRAIAALYRHESQSWQALLRIGLSKGADPAAQLKAGADRMVSLLPERLRVNPRWLAAGAMTGALGCVAAATLVAPAAIAALPAWAGLGAIVAAVIKPFQQPAATAPAAADLTAAVSSAALFAVLLELQGHDEALISRVIDRIVADDDPPLLNAAAARQWLAVLGQRFTLALRAEGLA